MGTSEETTQDITEKAVWRERGAPLVAGAGSGPLKGLRLAVKDVFAVAGHRIGAGVPAWLTEAEPESSSARAVAALLDAGAEVTGIAQTDELTYSLNGTNVHYGTPPNPAAPGRVPGGSSSGPASAVALGDADVGLGTDTAGSIRVPASYCGLYGMRPTRGAVSVEGVLPLAPAFDTVGWLARDAVTLARVGRVLLPERGGDEGHHPFRTALVASDMVALAHPDVRDAFGTAAAGLAERIGLEIVEIPAVGGDPQTRADAFSTAQGAQVWECDGAWVSRHPEALGPGIGERFARASRITAQEREAADAVVEETVRAAHEALPRGTVLLLPATSGPAPLPHSDGAGPPPTRNATISLTCLASMAGLPALVLPAMAVGGLPVGLCVVAAPGSDEELLELGILYGG